MPRFVSQIAQVFKSGTRGLATVSHETIQTVKETAPKSASSNPSSLNSSSSSKSQNSIPTPSYPQKLYKLVQSAIAKGEPHFRVGGKQLYFPTARVVLLRPNAKHTPYQAKFIVPKTFNKMDLRDYLYHLYGLRVFKVTTQLIAGKFVRSGSNARYRSPQIKKMTVDLMDPFIWPEEPVDKKEQFNINYMKDLDKYAEEARREGSDKFKPGKAFGGQLGPYPRKPEPFMTKALRKRLINLRTKEVGSNDRLENEKLISNYLDL